MFRAVNERLVELNRGFANFSGKFVVACECADEPCVETIELTADEYAVVRREPRRFVVLPGHVYPDVEAVISEHENYTVVEKLRRGAEVAERTAAG